MDRRLLQRTRAIATIIAVGLSATRCDTRPVEAPQGALTRTLLSDSPFPYSRVARVDVYVVSVSASLSPDTSSTATGFAMLATPNRRINLLGLQNGNTDELGAVQVQSGAVTAVRMASLATGRTCRQ